jgi:hypothetical protein
MISRIILRCSVVSDVARWTIVRLYEISGASNRSKKLVCVVKNTEFDKLIYFLYDGTYDKFIVCDNHGQTADDAVHYDTPRKLINAEWPCENGHSVVDLIYMFNNICLRIFSGIYLLFICYRGVSLTRK